MSIGSCPSDGLLQQEGDQDGRIFLRCLVAAPSPHHPVPVDRRARRCDDGPGEAHLTHQLDERDGVRRVARDAAVEDDGCDLVLVREELLAQLAERGCLDGADAELGQL